MDNRDALADITNKRMMVYGASKQYGIPDTTLRQHLKAPSGSLKVGKPTVLTANEEAEIVETCQLFASWGFGLTKAEVVSVVAEYFQYTKKANPFNKGIPGKDWWIQFQRCHPTLVSRQLQMT